MVEKLRSYDEEPLPQDLQEGVDDDEWVSKNHTSYLPNTKKWTVSFLACYPVIECELCWCEKRLY